MVFFRAPLSVSSVLRIVSEPSHSEPRRKVCNLKKNTTCYSSLCPRGTVGSAHEEGVAAAQRHVVGGACMNPSSGHDSLRR